MSLEVWEWPAGAPAALLLHGIANYGRYWDLVARAVAGRLRLVAPDLRGHGSSDAPRSGYDDEDFVLDALAVADAFGLERFVLAGHSLGGRHAIEVAAQLPERVSGLLVVDAGADVLPEGRDRARRLTTERPAFFADEAEALAYLRRTSPGYAEGVYSDRLRFAFRPAAGGGLEWRSASHALAAIMRGGARGEEAWRMWRSLPVPVTLLRGTRSYALSAETARRMVAELPGARLVEVEAGHNVALERPRETAEELLRLAR